MSIINTTMYLMVNSIVYVTEEDNDGGMLARMYFFLRALCNYLNNILTRFVTNCGAMNLTRYDTKIMFYIWKTNCKDEYVCDYDVT